jgi:hypothetical protein
VEWSVGVDSAGARERRKKKNFDTALNFSQVDLPYPAWNRVKTLCRSVETYSMKKDAV